MSGSAPLSRANVLAPLGLRIVFTGERGALLVSILCPTLRFCKLGTQELFEVRHIERDLSAPARAYDSLFHQPCTVLGSVIAGNPHALRYICYQAHILVLKHRPKERKVAVR